MMEAVHDVPPAAAYLSPVTSAFDTQTTYGVSGTVTKDVVIRNMVITDSDFIGRMETEAFHDKMEHLAGRGGLPRFVQAQKDYHRHLGDRYHRIFVAEVGGQRAGFIKLARIEDKFKEPDNFDWTDYVGCCTLMRFCCLGCAECCMAPKPRELYVAVLAVDAKFRGCGVGKALLDKGDAEGRALGCRMISLDVTTTNRARNLYERQGYVIAKRTDGCCFTSCAFGVRYFYRMEKLL